MPKKKPLKNGKVSSRRRIKVKQAKLVKGLVKGNTMTQAAIGAGYGKTPESARVSGHQALQNPTVQADLKRALEKAGLTFDVLAREIKRGLKKAEMGKHDSYIKLGLQAHGVGAKDDQAQAAPGMLAIIAIIREASEERGLDP